MRNKKLFLLPLMLVLTAISFSARALINPNFTPVVLVEESKDIIVINFKKTDKAGVFTGVVKEVLKGTKPAKDFVFDCNEAINTETAEYLEKHVLQFMDHPSLLFVGEFSDAEDGGAPMLDDDNDVKLFLHVGAKWIDIVTDDGDDTLGLDAVNSHMEGTWAGGSDMLLRAVKYKLADDSAEFPVAVGARWEPTVKIGNVPGLTLLRGVDLAGDGKQTLWVTSGEGDKLFQFDKAAGKVVDVTEAKKLTAKTAAGAWGDFNGDGLLDLASFNGKALELSAQQADGTFATQATAVPEGDVAGALSLLALDAGVKDKSSLVVVKSDGSVGLIKDLVAADAKVVALDGGGVGTADFGKCGYGLVADFDGDNIADVLCVFEQGSLLFKGKGAGEFAAAVKNEIAGGHGIASGAVADFDCNNLNDVFCAFSEGVRIWQNEGDGKFKEYVNTSGEIAYISKPNAVDAVICDVNNDGLQDVLISYSDIGAQIFFNRGFRSFGHAHEMDISEHQLLVVAEKGQKSSCAIDLNGDGAHDMIMGLPSGDVWYFQRDTSDGTPLAAVASLPIKHAFKGPVNVTGWIDDRQMGAWNVVPGTQDAFYGMPGAGVFTLKWQLPGGEPQQANLQIENKAKRLEIK